MSYERELQQPTGCRCEPGIPPSWAAVLLEPCPVHEPAPLPEAFYARAGVAIYQGDCREVMAAMPEASIHAVVTDPPYGLEFMGKAWDRLAAPEAYTTGAGRSSLPGIGDREIPWPNNQGWNAMRCRGCGHLSHGGSPCECETPDFAPADGRWAGMQAWHEAWAREALRVLKPGGYLLAFGGTRTFHRLMCAIEDAGFEVRDCVNWLYGSGFPKSLDVGKAIDKEAGAEREVIGPSNRQRGRTSADAPIGNYASYASLEDVVTAPATEAAKQWDGWGTALKPAWEPVVMARKPLAGTVAQNVLEHATGALNIDASRIGMSKDVPASPSRHETPFGGLGPETGNEPGHDPNIGRWPANVILDEEAAAMLDEQTGVLKAGGNMTDKVPTSQGFSGPVYGAPAAGARAWESYEDAGGASRFFYTAKASKAEREAAIEDFEAAWVDPSREEGSAARGSPRTGAGRQTKRKNTHPTVKPIALMRYLCRLVTPPGGLVLDPFMGSGTTLLAAERDRFRGIGIELDERYCEIAAKRLAQPVLL